MPWYVIYLCRFVQCKWPTSHITQFAPNVPPYSIHLYLSLGHNHNWLTSETITSLLCLIKPFYTVATSHSRDIINRIPRACIGLGRTLRTLVEGDINGTTTTPSPQRHALMMLLMLMQVEVQVAYDCIIYNTYVIYGPNQPYPQN